MDCPARGTSQEVTFAGARWRIERSTCQITPGEWRVSAEATMIEIAPVPIPVSLEIFAQLEQWHDKAYVFAPAAVYGGNRFKVRPVPYSPRIPEVDVSPRMPTIVSDVPRLSCEAEPSRFDLLAGDMATPCLGWHDSVCGHGVLLLTEPFQSGRETGFCVEETAARDTAWFRIAVPGVRPRRYRHMTTQAESADRGAILSPGESLRAVVRILDVKATTLHEFFDTFLEVRRTVGSRTPPAEFPWSAAWAVIEEKNNREAWNERFGFYATDTRPGNHYYYQTGWCGGLIATYPLLVDGTPLSAERARRNLATALNGGIAPGGLFWGKHLETGTWMADFAHDQTRPYTHRWTLVRRQGDALFYGLRQIEAAESFDSAWRCPEHWLAALRKVADVFVRTWRTDGQLGHFLDQYTGAVIVGGSASASIVPAALLLAARRLGANEYRAVAEEIATALVRDCLEPGVMTGGPGDALQNPDSESVAALLESLVLLFDETGDARWLDAARLAAAQLATWVMSYDYPFPPHTEFGRLRLRTNGTLFANTQNKHSAPGICTHAGLGLLRLYRSTGDMRYLELLRDIARALSQFVSREDRPIFAQDGRTLPPGWINERVNTSDWDDNLGGVLHGPCWCEVSMMLTWTELPGLYIRPDVGLVCALDHIDATDVRLSTHGVSATVTNPTRFPAKVRMWSETAEQVRFPLVPGYLQRCEVLCLAPGESRTLAWPR